MATKHTRSAKAALLAGAMLVAWPALAAEVTPERLVNADKEPQNWLMNHRTYNGQRFSPLDKINKSNVKGLKLAYAVPLGGTATQRVQRIDAARRGRLSLRRRLLGRALQDRRPLRRCRPHRLAHGSEAAEAGDQPRRDLLGQLVISPANQPARIIATDKETGKVVWETNVVGDQPLTDITGAPLAIKDKIIVGASGGDKGVRDWVAALDAATGKLLWQKYTIPAPGEPGSDTWKDKNNAWRTGGGAVWVTGTYDPETNQTFWGVGNPVPMMDARLRPGDNLFTNSVISCNPDDGKMNWYFQFTPGDMWDFDEVGTHILIDGQSTANRAS